MGMLDIKRTLKYIMMTIIMKTITIPKISLAINITTKTNNHKIIRKNNTSANNLIKNNVLALVTEKLLITVNQKYQLLKNPLELISL